MFLKEPQNIFTKMLFIAIVSPKKPFDIIFLSSGLILAITHILYVLEKCNLIKNYLLTNVVDKLVIISPAFAIIYLVCFLIYLFYNKVKCRC